MNWRNWLKQASAKVHRALRHTTPGIVAYYWDGGAPRENTVNDISLTGAYVRTPDQWCVGTIIWVAFRREGVEGESSTSSITLPCRVVRDGPDGFGVNFVLTEGKKRKALEHFIHDAVAHQAQRTQDTSQTQASLETKP